MRYLNIAFPDPAHNLALDEVLLDEAEAGHGEAVRIWESPVHFVVLGLSQILAKEVHEPQCQQDSVPILRRCSGGGCVLQGPGCLNYSLVLSHTERPELRTINDSYRHILARLCQALQQRGVTAVHKGISDIAIEDRKISGNAQKRKRTHLLHHGTLLYAMTPERIERYLREPDDRPPYRGTRAHAAFVQTVPLTAHELTAAIREAYSVQTPPEKPHRHELEAVTALVNEKYQTEDWIRRR